jgi:predicted enzyme related to lactoylglutathione lyase
MERAAVAVAKKPVWVDLSSTDAGASRDFYSKLFGWNVEVNPDPQYGEYGLAKIDGKDVAGIGGQIAPGAPTTWNLYIGTDDAEKLAQDVKSAGGTVVAPPFDVGEMGRMAVFQDPTGAFISTWQTTRMGGFQSEGSNTYAWAELNSRGLEKAIPFYEKVFGWTAKKSEVTPEGAPPYTELQLDGQSILGAMEINPAMPAEVPSYWMIYFGVEDVDAYFRKAIDTGAREMLAPQDFPGGRFAIVTDPQGAMFGLLKMEPR